MLCTPSYLGTLRKKKQYAGGFAQTPQRFLFFALRFMRFIIYARAGHFTHAGLCFVALKWDL
jgi:hypothetical protein